MACAHRIATASVVIVTEISAHQTLKFKATKLVVPYANSVRTAILATATKVCAKRTVLPKARLEDMEDVIKMACASLVNVRKGNVDEASTRNRMEGKNVKKVTV